MSVLDQLRATPNLLTLLRLLTIPFLLIAILDGHVGLAFSLFLLAGLTDAFDGLHVIVMRGECATRESSLILAALPDQRNFVW